VITERFLSGLSKQDQDVGEQVRRWLPKLRNVASELSRVTGDSYEDILQDALEKLVVNVLDYRTPQVRYRKQIWEILEDGDNLKLRRRGQELVLPKADCEEIKKASMGTFVYNGLIQFCADRFAKHYTEKNGYRVDSNAPTIERKYLDRSKRQIITRTTPNYVRTSGETSAKVVTRDDGTEQDEIDVAQAQFESPEDGAVYRSYLEVLRSRLSDEANRLLALLLQEDVDYLDETSLGILAAQQGGFQVPTPRIDLNRASKHLGKTRVEVKALWLEVIGALPQEFLNLTTLVASKGGYLKENLVRDALKSQ
jgi:hypothetical protein